MADASARFADNAPGKYYVDDTCNACMMCVDVAPNHFKMTDDDEHALVIKQPMTPEEEELCEEAMESCPDEAIGNDG